MSFQLWFSAIHYLKISEQRPFSSHECWKMFQTTKVNAEQPTCFFYSKWHFLFYFQFYQCWSALMFFMFSESALKNKKSLKQRCSALIISTISSRVNCFEKQNRSFFGRWNEKQYLKTSTFLIINRLKKNFRGNLWNTTFSRNRSPLVSTVSLTSK